MLDNKKWYQENGVVYNKEHEYTISITTLNGTMTFQPEMAEKIVKALNESVRAETLVMPKIADYNTIKKILEDCVKYKIIVNKFDAPTENIFAEDEIIIDIAFTTQMIKNYIDSNFSA